MNIPDREAFTRKVALVAQWGGWSGSMAFGAYSAFTYDPRTDNIAPPWVGLAFVFLIGIALAGTAARSRMRLQDILTKTLQVGLSATLENQRRIAELEKKVSEAADHPGGRGR